MLKQMRNSPFKSQMFEGGRGGEAFGELYDQHLIDRMSSGVGNKLVGAIVRKIVNKNESAADAAKASAAYTRQSTLGPAAASMPSPAGGNPQGQSGARQFAQKRRTAAPADGNSFQNVRMHVAPGR
jgi:Rod binding domain-containing protein